MRVRENALTANIRAYISLNCADMRIGKKWRMAIPTCNTRHVLPMKMKYILVIPQRRQYKSLKFFEFPSMLYEPKGFVTQKIEDDVTMNI